MRFDAAGVIRLAVAGELDAITAPQLDRALRRAQADAALVVLDLRGLECVDASGGRVVSAADRRARAAGAGLAVVRGPVEVDRFLELTGFNHGLWLVDRPAAADEPERETSPSAPAQRAVDPVETEWTAPLGELDRPALLGLEQRLVDAWASGHRRFRIDLAAIVSPAGPALSLLCGTLRRLTQRGVIVTVAGAEPFVRRALELRVIGGVEFAPPAPPRRSGR